MLTPWAVGDRDISWGMRVPAVREGPVGDEKWDLENGNGTWGVGELAGEGDEVLEEPCKTRDMGGLSFFQGS